MKRIVIDFLHESVVAEVELEAAVGAQMLPPIVVRRSASALSDILLLIQRAVPADPEPEPEVVAAPVEIPPSNVVPLVPAPVIEAIPAAETPVQEPA